jgi:hypothetical protein
MSDQGKQYVYNGVLLRCDKGVIPTPFTVLPRPSLIRGQFQAHELDLVPLTNIKPFGVCAITRGPCMPAPLRWTEVHQGSLRLGLASARPLLESSVCHCGVGGSISIIMPPVLPAAPAAVATGAPAEAPAPPAEAPGDATAHEVAESFKLAALGFAVLGVGLAIAGCFFPPLELAAGASFEAALAASAGTAFIAADVSMAVGIGIDVAVAQVHPTPANRAVVVGDVVGVAIGYGAGRALGALASKYGPAVSEAFARRAAAKAAAEEAALGKAVKIEVSLPEGIEANPQGVYGYLPKPGSRYAGSDFSNPAEVAKNRAIRLKYLEESKQIDEEVTKMTQANAPPEAIARRTVEIRNQQKVDARSNMDAEGVRRLEEGNMEKYGHPVGPTADQLYEKYGSWEQVIQKSTQKDEAINMLLGIKH